MMEENNKTYGFTIAIKELRETVPNIFRYASAYMRTNNVTSQGLWEMFVENDKEKDRKKKQAADGAKRKTSKKPLPEEILNTEPGKGSLESIDPDAMEGESYNMCHFWSNFEIANLDWFRSKEYNDFFNMMDRSGGFWMERVSSQFQHLHRFGANVLSYSGEMPLSIL
jgi:mannosyltransferase